MRVVVSIPTQNWLEDVQNIPLEKINETQYFGYIIVIKNIVKNIIAYSDNSLSSLQKSVYTFRITLVLLKKLQVQQKHCHHKILRDAFFSFSPVFFFSGVLDQIIANNIWNSIGW